MITEMLKTLLYLATFAIVVLLAFIFTKYIAKKSSSLSRNKNINMIDAISLGNNTRIFIVEVLGILYIIYDNNSHVLLLDKIDKEESNIQFKNIENDNNNLNNIITSLINQKNNIREKVNNRKNNNDKNIN